MESLEREQKRLTHEVTLRADAERRHWPFLLSQDIAVVAFALTPLVPHADRFFGALTAPVALALALPPLVASHVSAVIHRKWGSDARAYLAWESIETFLLYMNVLWFIWVSGIERSAFWILNPVTAAFWATKKPFAGKMYGSIIALAHTLLAVLYLAHGRSAGAIIALAVGGATFLTYQSIARSGRANLKLEAERNVLAAELVEANLAAERGRIADMLHARTGHELGLLTRELRRDGNPDLERVLDDLDDLASAAYASNVETTLAQTLQRIDEKCKVLVERIEFSTELMGDAGAKVEASVAHAFLRVAQELTRNAMVHGKAQRVRILVAAETEAFALSVNDDGIGMSPETFARGTGGVANAKRWVSELGGALELVETKSGTTLRAHVPRR